MKFYLSIFTLLLCVSFAGYAQKVKFDEGLVFVDEMDWAKWSGNKLSNDRSISSLTTDEELIFLRWDDFYDPSEVSAANKDGKNRYVEINFLTLGKKCEVPVDMPKGIVKLLYENKVLVDSKIQPENVERMIAKYGMKYTERRKELNSPVNIIINK